MGAATAPRLSLDAIRNELARRSFREWCRLRFKIMPKNGIETTLRFNRAQEMVYAAEERMMREKGRVRLFILKGRQGGVTTFEQARSLHLCSTMTGAGALTLTDTGDTTDKVFYITQFAVERADPDTLPEMGEKRAHELHFTKLASRFFTGTAGSKRVGRAITLRRLHGSEFALWDNPMGTLKSVTPAIVPRGHSIILETTASGFESEAHRFYKRCQAGKTSYETLFIPWWLCDQENYRLPLMEPDELGQLDDAESALVEMHGLTLEEIKWRRSEIADKGVHDFLQEYPEDEESCWLAAGGMYYDAAILRELTQRAPELIRTEEDGDLEIYSEYVPGERIILGADTAEGVGGDASTYSARAMLGWAMREAFSSSTIQPREFAALLARRGRALGGAFLVVEKNFHGITVLRHLRDDEHYPVGLIYHRAPLDQADPQSSERIGWQTTAESKAIMLGAGRELFTAAKAGLAGVPVKQVCLDALGVRRNDLGRYELNGKDMLVADMLAWIGRSTPLPGAGMFEWMQQQAAAAAAKKAKGPKPPG